MGDLKAVRRRSVYGTVIVNHVAPCHDKLAVIPYTSQTIHKGMYQMPEENREKDEPLFGFLSQLNPIFILGIGFLVGFMFGISIGLSV